jgi:hypothetical protein
MKALCFCEVQAVYFADIAEEHNREWSNAVAGGLVSSHSEGSMQHSDPAEEEEGRGGIMSGRLHEILLQLELWGRAGVELGRVVFVE